MAGVKGRSGGARANSGGRREGAGRKPKATDASVATRDPLEFLLDVMMGRIEPSTAQLKAAQAAAKFIHAPKAPGGKKEGKEEAAKGAVAGKFKPGSAPRLVTVGGQKVAGG